MSLNTMHNVSLTEGQISTILYTMEGYMQGSDDNEDSQFQQDVDDIFEICEKKFKDHVIYARIIQGVDDLEKNYKVMDLSNPMIDENEKKYLDEVAKSKELNYIPEQFISLYNEDQLGGMIRNLDYWLKENFERLHI